LETKKIESKQLKAESRRVFRERLSMEQQQAKEALEKEKQNQIINGKTYLQTLALQ